MIRYRLYIYIYISMGACDCIAALLMHDDACA